jgi:hypothetical protein
MLGMSPGQALLRADTKTGTMKQNSQWAFVKAGKDKRMGRWAWDGRRCPLVSISLEKRKIPTPSILVMIKSEMQIGRAKITPPLLGQVPQNCV